MVTPFWKAGAPILLKYLIVVGLGLWAGFSARGLLKSRTQILKLLTAWAAAALSLAALSILSGGFLGFKLVNDQGQTPDWSGLLQFGAAAAAAWLVVQAFRPAPGAERSPAPPPALPVLMPEARPLIKEKAPKLSPPTRKQAAPKAAAGTKKTPPKKKAAPPAGKTKARQKTAPLTAANRAKAQAPAPEARSTKKALKEIKFIGAAEHTCPYCLDPVMPTTRAGLRSARSARPTTTPTAGASPAPARSPMPISKFGIIGGPHARN